MRQVRQYCAADWQRGWPGVCLGVQIDWLINYKTSDGKPQNTLRSTTPGDKQAAEVVIEATHKQWSALVTMPPVTVVVHVRACSLLSPYSCSSDVWLSLRYRDRERSARRLRPNFI
jgi:hypothetical protein